MRPQQWYKNLIVFVPLVFSGNLTNLQLWPIAILGFLALCLVSSISYIANDIIDAESDRRHPEKKNRPLPSGRVKTMEAIILALVLALASLLIFANTNILFALLATGLFVSTLAYSLYLKNKPIIDVHVIAFNYVIRALAGVVLIGAALSGWLVLTIFLLALFWALGKRKYEIVSLGAGARAHKAVYGFYTPDMLTSLTDIVAAMLLMAYSLYTLSVGPSRMMLTIPLASFMIFRYIYLVHTNSPLIHKSERLFLDRQMLLGMAAWLSLVVIILYKLA